MSPQVPVLQGPEVEPARLRPNYSDSSTPDNAFGEGVARAGLRVGAALTNQSEAMQHAANVADTARVDSELATFQIDRMNLTDEGLQRQGQAAVGATPDTVAKILDAAKERARNLANDRQRNKFILHAQEMVASSKAALMRHESGEATTLADNSATARIVNAGDAAARYWTQPEVIAGSLKEAESAVNSRADAQGWTPEIRAAAQADAKSGVLSSVMASMDTQGAHAAFIKFYQEHEGELSAADRVKFAKVYQTTADAANVYAAADAIYKANSTFDANGKLVRLSEQAAYDAANQAPVAIRKDVIQEVNRMVGEAKEADNTRRVTLDRTAWQLFERGGIKAIPMAVQAEMDGSVLQQMKTAERVSVAAGPEPMDWDAYGAYEAQLPEDRITKGNTALDRLLGKVPRSILKEKIDEETVIRDQTLGLRTSGAAIKGPSLDRQGIAGVISTAILENGGLFETPETISERNTLKGKFARFVRTEADAFQAKEHRNPNYDEMQGIIDRGLIEQTRPSGPWGWFSTTRRAFEETPQATSSTPTVPAMPATTRAAIVEKLRSGGFAITEANIQKQYAHDFPQGVQ